MLLSATGSVWGQSNGDCGAESWISYGWKDLDRKEAGNFSEDLKSKPANYPISCGRLNFDLFFQLFSEDRYFQESATAFPLKITTISPKYIPSREETDSGLDFTRDVAFLTPKNNDRGGINIFPNRRQRSCARLSFFFEPYKNSGQKISVILRGEGGLWHEYIFKWDGCWFLAEITDSST